LLQQLAGVAALKDRDHFWAAIRHNNQWLAWITAEIRTLGLRVDDSAANFVLIHFPPGAEGAKGMGAGKSAAAADAFLMKHGVILRGVASYGLPDCLRMTVGTEAQNRLAVSLIQQFMAE
jgi:histidinol-phosphate aminotransferase